MDNMADEGSAGTFEYTLGGRVVTFKTVERDQITMLQRYVETLQRKASTMRDAQDLDGVLAVGKKISEATWATIESQFLTPQDLEWTQLEIIAGRIKEKDLLPLLSNGVIRTETQDDDDPVTTKRPGRKAPAKKPAKKAPAKRVAR